MRLLGEEIYILPFEKAPDKSLIYAPVRGYAGEIESWEAEALTVNSILAEDEQKKNPIVNRHIRSFREMPLKDLDVMQAGPPALNIDLSNGCNMRCLYCYAGRGEGRIRYQRKENIDRIIAVYFDYLQQQAFSAGTTCPIVFSNDAEPTFSPDLLIYTVRMIREKARLYGLKTCFTTPTNGAFNRSLRDFLIEHFDRISFSFDGPEDIQNKQRPLADGTSSYGVVYNNIKALYKSDVKIGFNIVVTGLNIDRLKETVDLFHIHFPGSEISFSPVSLSGRALKENNNLRIEQEAYRDKLAEVLNYAGHTSIKIQDKNIQNYRMPRRHFCSSTAKPNWNVNLDGCIYACMECKSEEMKIGEIRFDTQQLRLESGRINELKAYSVENMDKCRDCFAKYLCTGGCMVRGRPDEGACEGIRQKCLFLIHRDYENEQLIKLGQKLFAKEVKV